MFISFDEYLQIEALINKRVAQGIADAGPPQPCAECARLREQLKAAQVCGLPVDDCGDCVLLHGCASCAAYRKCGGEMLVECSSGRCQWRPKGGDSTS